MDSKTVALAADIIILPAGSKVSVVSVTTACSGAEGALVFLALAGGMAVDVGRKTPKKNLLELVALGAVGVTLGNMLRVPLLIEAAYYFGAGATETFHLYSGAVIFLTFVALFFFASPERLSNPRPPIGAAQAQWFGRLTGSKLRRPRHLWRPYPGAEGVED